jgi:hypothetical protein
MKIQVIAIVAFAFLLSCKTEKSERRRITNWIKSRTNLTSDCKFEFSSDSIIYFYKDGFKIDSATVIKVENDIQLVFRKKEVDWHSNNMIRVDYLFSTNSPFFYSIKLEGLKMHLRNIAKLADNGYILQYYFNNDELKNKYITNFDTLITKGQYLSSGQIRYKYDSSFFIIDATDSSKHFFPSQMDSIVATGYLFLDLMNPIGRETL